MYFSLFTTSQYSFEGKKQYEHVIVLLYRHWFVLAVKAGLFLFLGVLPFVLFVLTRDVLVSLDLGGLFWFGVGGYFLVWWCGLFYVLTMYLLDTWIVTDHRIIDSQQFGFFKRSVAELNLSKIQDISVVISGPIPTFLDYGNLEIQTAGAENRFLFEQIPHPNRIKDEIMHAHYDYRESHQDDTEPHDDAI